MVGLKIKEYLDENGIKYSYLSERAGMPMNILSWSKGLCNSHWRRERIRCNKYKPYHITYRRGGVIETF